MKSSQILSNSFSLAARLAGCALLLAGTTVACQAQYILGPQGRIAGADPFAGSTLDHPGQQNGSPSPNSTVEPWFTVHPTNPFYMVATYQQDRWTGNDGGSRGLMEAWSDDGGLTWNPVVVPGIGLTSGGIYERDSDPWNAFAANGDLYHVSLAFNDTSPGNAVLVSKSTDGGQTWSTPITVVENGSDGFNDKESVTADPFDYHYVYVVWDRNNVPLFSRTANAGAAWSTPIQQASSPNTIDHQVVVAPNDTLYDFFDDYTNGDTVAFVTSTDRGTTWSTNETTPFLERDRGIYDPVGSDAIRDSAGLFPVAVDRHNGNLYVTWMDSQFSNGQIDEIAFSGSTDGGKTWSTPIKINQTPTGIPIGDRQALIPSIAVAGDGTICVAYYDFRNSAGSGGPLWTDRWAVFCHPSPATPFSSAGSWGNELRLTSTSFDFHLAPYSDQGRMVGDYMHMEAIGSEFIDVFGIATADHPSLIVSRRIVRFVRSDFNADGNSDLLFQNPSTGQLALWYVNKSSQAGGAFIYPAQNPTWKAVGVADFDADGHPDILFQNSSTGQLAIWYMNNNYLKGAAFVYPSQDPAWQAVAVADQSTPGQPVIVFQNSTTGQLAIWYMNNNYQTGGAYVYPIQNPSWKVVGAGDFNGDWHTDILFQNSTTGQLAIWYMNNTVQTGAAFVYPTQNPAWKAAGVADLNGDGYPDIIFQNSSTGQMAVWYMNNNYATGAAYIQPSQNPAWKLVGPH